VEPEERTEKLLEACELLKKAYVMIDEALYMSGMETRGKKLLDSLDGYISSNNDSGSIPNIIADIESANADPCWTLPYVSVKHFNGKNI
jgi:hypothetical protein